MDIRFTSRNSNISVVGAAGKMGRGILLLLARNMVEDQIKLTEPRSLFAIDISKKSLKDTSDYIEKQSVKFAKKKLNEIKLLFKDNKALTSDESFIEQYVTEISSIIIFSTDISLTFNSTLIFEAVAEREELKVDLYKLIAKNSNLEQYFFSNTSSIPISSMETKAGIEGRLVGFHFYNPPPVQKLLEIIKPSKITDELSKLAKGLAKQFGKTIINAPDKHGFIGNGQFIREISYAIDTVLELAKSSDINESIFLVNLITKKYLLRPMGIFEVMDFVGIKVCLSIMNVMKGAFENENFNDSLLHDLLNNKMYGGQDENGELKNGVFKYHQGEIVAVFNGHQYITVSKISPYKTNSYSWKELKNDIDLTGKLNNHFSTLNKAPDFKSNLAVKYARSCKSIGEGLVEKGIAFNVEDVNSVMILGFHHLYGPVNKFFDERT